MANKECKIWIMKKLFPKGIDKLTGKEFEVTTVGRKKSDWAIESDDKKNVILIEDKETGDSGFNEAKKQVITYSQEIIDKYNNIISIAVKQDAKTNGFHVAVYVNGLLKEDEKPDNLNPLDYYWSLINKKFDKEIIIKNIGELNNTLHKLKIADNIRASLASTFLVCINKGMQLTPDDDLDTIKSKVDKALHKYCYDENGENLNKWKKISTLFETFCLDLQKQKSYLNSETLYTVWKEIKYKIFEYTKDTRGMEGYDVMSLFFTTFSKAALSNDKGQYFTPDHISSLMVELINLNVNSKVLDPTCGSGTFLAKCMDKMISLTKNDEDKIKEIKQNQIFGIEKDDIVYGLATANMLLHKDGKSNIENANCFELIDKWLKAKQEGRKYPLIDRLIMNPPYQEKTDDIPEMQFLLKALEVMQPNGLATIILPISCANADDSIPWKKALLEKHRLIACLTMNTEIFYPTAIGTCVMVFEAHVPHFGPTYLASWRNDQHIKIRMAKKNTVRYCKPEIWKSIFEKWLSDYKLKVNGLNIELTPEMQWLYEANAKFDCTTLSNNNFAKQINNYYSSKLTAAVIPNKKIEFNTWHDFLLSDVLKREKISSISKNIRDFEEGNIPVVSNTSVNNGVKRFLSLGNQDKKYLHKGNCLSYGAKGGLFFYQEKDWLSTDHVHKFVSPHLNKYNGIFICSILNELVHQVGGWCFGLESNILDKTIKLPAIQNSDGSYSPDWDYMESYIKSLPYSDKI